MQKCGTVEVDSSPKHHFVEEFVDTSESATITPRKRNTDEPVFQLPTIAEQDSEAISPSALKLQDPFNKPWQSLTLFKYDT